MPEAGRQKEWKFPPVLAETEHLSKEEWLAFRRRGIGGSDVAALMGISPFRTARDLYYDKLGVLPEEELPDNWVALEMGTLLEDLVVKIFEKKTGLRTFQVKKMFRHPRYSFMLADVDRLVEMPDGSLAILEIKTTNYNAKDLWFRNGQEVIPSYYEAQGRHYMSVMDVDQVFFCCLYGNTEDEVIFRSLRRDVDYEEEMIFLEKYFWATHVQPKIPPDYTESGSLILDSLKRHGEAADTTSSEYTLGAKASAILMQYMELQKKKENADQHTRALDEELKRLRALLIADMGNKCTAVFQKDGMDYTITYKSVKKSGISKDHLTRLKLLHPDIYEEFVTVSDYRSFRIKVKAAKAA